MDRAMPARCRSVWDWLILRRGGGAQFGTNLLCYTMKCAQFSRQCNRTSTGESKELNMHTWEDTGFDSFKTHTRRKWKLYEYDNIISVRPWWRDDATATCLELKLKLFPRSVSLSKLEGRKVFFLSKWQLQTLPFVTSHHSLLPVDGST